MSRRMNGNVLSNGRRRPNIHHAKRPAIRIRPSATPSAAGNRSRDAGRTAYRHPSRNTVAQFGSSM